MSYMKRYAEDLEQVRELAGLAWHRHGGDPHGRRAGLRAVLDHCGSLAARYHDPVAVAANLSVEAQNTYLETAQQSKRSGAAV
ncbi:hypothetical protein ABT354_11120 [Streptomyces sp. NPDC000594]|uniref:hypothetical protein n=1 Tax=Streptomyces sp. NPDC000594 TaxID=3154261 RepID=UPI003327D78D